MRASEQGKFDLCIVGLGIGGLNALYVAVQHLPKGSKIALVDRHPDVGGMWNESYDHVRLHQPHQMFTVGDLNWEWDKPPDYLATGQEVQAHLASCLRRLEKDFVVEKFFRHDCLDCVDEGDCARVTVRRLKGQKKFDLIADRAILTTGWGIPKIEPMELSSRKVVSSSAARIMEDDADPNAPVYVVGGGKTGTDTAQFLLEQNPNRKVTLINGLGNVFGNRDLLFPMGLGRFWKGH